VHLLAADPKDVGGFCDAYEVLGHGLIVGA
jgi:hypothetical protein